MNLRLLRRLLWGFGGAVGALTAVMAGWQAFGSIGAFQYVTAGITALLGGAFAFYQASSSAQPTAGSSARYPIPRELPRGIADFTGRVEDIAELIRVLRRSGGSSGPLVAIAGKGGLGKTTLAVEVAHRVAPNFPDGQLFANLRGYDSVPAEPVEVLGSFLRSLGVDPRAIPEALPDRQQLLRTLTADRRLLVVLDNANGPQQIRPLLPGGVDNAVIITSRARLSSLEGAHMLMLGLLEPDEALELLGRVAGTSRLAGEPGAGQRLVRLCGYLPLAVRIAGARLAERPDLSPTDLADRLVDEHDRLEHLKMGDLDVRSTFMISFRELPDSQQRAFRLLGLFPGSDFAAWTLSALMDVTLPVAESHLDALVSAQLLDVVGPDETGVTRYRFHDLLRALARELPEPDIAAATARLLGAYVYLAAKAEDRFQPGEVRKTGNHQRHPIETKARDKLLRDPATWFVSELPNIVACVRLAYEHELWDAAWELAHIAAPFYEMLGAWDDWALAGKLALDAAGRAGNQWAESITMFDAAALQRDRNRLDEAMTAYDGALAGYEATGDTHGIAAVLLGQGIIFRNRRAWDEAAHRLSEAADRLRAAKDRRLAAQARRSLAVVRTGQGRFDEAIPLFNEALAEFQRLGDRRAEAYSWRGLGQAEIGSGELTRAKESFSRSLDLTRRLGDRRGEARALQGLGRVTVAEGAAAAALRWFDQARQIAEEANDQVLKAELDADAATVIRR